MLNKFLKYVLVIFVILLLVIIVNGERLPVVGSDEGDWGTILNNFLNREHTVNGTHGNVTAESLNVTGTSYFNTSYVGLWNGVRVVDGDKFPTIQDAIDDCPVTGCTVYIPLGTYNISSPIAINNSKILRLIGAGTGCLGSTGATIIRNNANDDAIFASWLGDIVIEDLKIEDGFGAGRTTGDGIHAERSTDVGNMRLTVRNVEISEHYNGIRIKHAVLTRFEQVWAEDNLNHGFFLEANNIHAGTSASFHTTFAVRNALDGYHVDGHGYCNFENSAADNNGRDGYRISNDSGINPNGISFFGVGSENNAEDGIHVGMSATSINIFGGTLSLNTGDGIEFESCNGCSVIGTKIVSSTGYGIHTSGNGTKITIINPHLLSNAAGDLHDPNSQMTRLDYPSRGLLWPMEYTYGAPIVGLTETGGRIWFSKSTVGVSTFSGEVARFAGLHFLPGASGQNLGSTSVRWDLFGIDGDFSGDLIVNGSTLFTNATSGNVGINTTSPNATLTVNGVMQTLPRSTATCNAQAEGGIYYDSDDSHFYGCNSTDWVQLDN